MSALNFFLDCSGPVERGSWAQFLVDDGLCFFVISGRGGVHDNRYNHVGVLSKDLSTVCSAFFFLCISLVRLGGVILSRFVFLDAAGRSFGGVPTYLFNCFLF